VWAAPEGAALSVQATASADNDVLGAASGTTSASAVSYAYSSCRCALGHQVPAYSRDALDGLHALDLEELEVVVVVLLRDVVDPLRQAVVLHGVCRRLVGLLVAELGELEVEVVLLQRHQFVETLAGNGGLLRLDDPLASFAPDGCSAVDLEVLLLIVFDDGLEVWPTAALQLTRIETPAPLLSALADTEVAAPEPALSPERVADTGGHLARVRHEVHDARGQDAQGVVKGMYSLGVLEKRDDLPEALVLEVLGDVVVVEQSSPPRLFLNGRSPPYVKQGYELLFSTDETIPPERITIIIAQKCI
jgi:hypothetical protein